MLAAMRKAAALALLALAVAAPTASASRPWLSVRRARVAMRYPDTIVTHECTRRSRTVVGCNVKWEGVFEPEPGEGDHNEAIVWGRLCGNHVYVTALIPIQSCREARHFFRHRHTHGH